jgi:PAS domain-containing protein
MQPGRISQPEPVASWVEALLQNGLVGVFRTTISGEIRFVNQALIQLLEADCAGAVIEAGAARWYQNPADRNRLLALLRRDRKVRGFETAVTTAAGTSRQVLVSAVLDGEDISGVVMDISDRKRAELA